MILTVQIPPHPHFVQEHKYKTPYLPISIHCSEETHQAKRSWITEAEQLRLYDCVCCSSCSSFSVPPEAPPRSPLLPKWKLFPTTAADKAWLAVPNMLDELQYWSWDRKRMYSKRKKHQTDDAWPNLQVFEWPGWSGSLLWTFQQPGIGQVEQFFWWECVIKTIILS